MSNAVPAAHRRAALLAAAVAVFLAAAPAQAGTEVRVTIEPPIVGLDEVAVLSIEAKSDSLGSLGFDPAFELDNLELMGSPMRSENVSIVNGSFSRSLRVSWQLRPLKVGRARVRGIAVQIRGQVLQLGSRDLEVRRQGLSGRSADEQGGEPGDEEAPPDPFDRFFGPSPLRQMFEPFRARRPRVFLRAAVEPAHPYVGQQTVYTIYLYTREDISAINPTSIPSFRGFWVHDVPQPEHLPTDMVEVDGERFGRVALLRKALFPLRPGLHTIEPSEMDLIVRTVERGFFGPPLERPQQVSLKAEGIPVDVRPLPPPPPGFSGAVGRLALSSQVAPPALRVGEAATLEVTLSGAGHLQGVPPPRLVDAPWLEVLPPQQQGEDEIAGGVLRGKQTWSYALVPKRAGNFRLAVPAITYFDPAAGEYRVATAPAVELKAQPAALAAATAVGPQTPHEVRGAGASRADRLIDRLASSLPDRRRLLPWLFGLPLAGAAIASLSRRRLSPAMLVAPGGEVEGAGPDPARHRQARRRLEEQLEEIAAEGRPRQIAVSLEEAWRHYLVLRWGLPPATLPSQWGTALSPRISQRTGAAGELSTELARLAEDLDYLRHAPQLAAIGALRDDALARSRRLLRLLR